MSSVAPGKRDLAHGALRRACADVSAIATSAEFGLMALIMLFVRFTRPKDWQDWRDSKDVITNGLWDALRDELGPGVDAPMQTLLTLPPAMHNDFIKVTDRAVKQLGYTEVFQLVVEEFAWENDVFTPKSVTEILANIIDADSVTSVYDPFCRAGELLVAAGARAGGDSVDEAVTVWGETPNFRSQAIAQMNLRLHEIDGGIGPQMSTPIVGLPKASVIITNPPFNVKGWTPFRDRNWRYGSPPEKNANFAWLQYVLERLEPDGEAAVLMANNAAFSANDRERRIREGMVLDGCIQALISLPPSLFHGTGVSATIWLLRAPGTHPNVGHDVLFVDASKAGHMVNRNRRELADWEIREIIEIVTADRTFEQITSETVRCTSASLGEIQALDFNLSPAAYLPGNQINDAPNVTDLMARWEFELEAVQRSDFLVRNAVSSLAHTKSFIGATSTSWPKVHLADVCELIPGAPTKDAPNDLGAIPILKAKNLLLGRLTGETDMADASEASRNSRYRVEVGDLLCARTGTMGKVGLVTAEQQGWIFGSGLICIRVRPDQELEPKFLVAYFMSPAVIDWVMRNSGGTSIPSISAKTLSTLPVSLPPLRVQYAIAETMDVFAESSAAHERAHQAANRLRGALFPLFFSGKI